MKELAKNSDEAWSYSRSQVILQVPPCRCYVVNSDWSMHWGRGASHGRNIQDVRSTSKTYLDRMESFFIAETQKYLLLLQADPFPEPKFETVFEHPGPTLAGKTKGERRLINHGFKTGLAQSWLRPSLFVLFGDPEHA